MRTQCPKSLVNTETRPVFRRTIMCELVLSHVTCRCHFACVGAELHLNNKDRVHVSHEQCRQSLLGCDTFQVSDTVCTCQNSQLTADSASKPLFTRVPLLQSLCVSAADVWLHPEKSSSICDTRSLTEATQETNPLMPLQPSAVTVSFTS